MKNTRLVIGTNFSDCAINAAVYALHLFKQQIIQARLVFSLSDFLDVTDLAEELIESDSSDLPPLSVSSLELMYNKKLHSLNDYLQSLAPKGSVIDNMLIHGYPEEVINKQVADFNADMVVVGSSGKPGTLAELMGSKTSDIIKKSAVPVLAVPYEAKIPEKGLKTVMYLTDFRQADFTSLHRFIEWLPQPNCTIYCLHYCNEKPDKWDQKRLEELQNYCIKTYRNQNVVCDMLVGDKMVDDISRYISSKKIELIGITRKRRNVISQWMHPEVAYKLLFHARVPFMLFCD